MIERQALADSLDSLLQPERFKDYCPNGLQVEGCTHIRKIVSGVTASLAFLRAAVDAQADAVLVHHGLFWRGHDGRVTGWMRKRLALVLSHNLNLFAYHLPLDAHPELGNNAQFGRQLGLDVQQRFGDQMLGFAGQPRAGAFADSAALAQHLQIQLGRSVTMVSGHDRPVQRVAWCTGGAQGYFEDAIRSGCDAFITGEISEPQAHYAQECGVTYIACGHHASERYGAPAVAQFVADQHGMDHHFIDIDNPA